MVENSIQEDINRDEKQHPEGRRWIGRNEERYERTGGEQ